jgi:hypothetical protein
MRHRHASPICANPVVGRLVVVSSRPTAASLRHAFVSVRRSELDREPPLIHSHMTVALAEQHRCQLRAEADRNRQARVARRARRADVTTRRPRRRLRASAVSVLALFARRRRRDRAEPVSDTCDRAAAAYVKVTSP